MQILRNTGRRAVTRPSSTLSVYAAGFDAVTPDTAAEARLCLPVCLRPDLYLHMKRSLQIHSSRSKTGMKVKLGRLKQSLNAYVTNGNRFRHCAAK